MKQKVLRYDFFVNYIGLLTVSFFRESNSCLCQTIKLMNQEELKSLTSIIIFQI